MSITSRTCISADPHTVYIYTPFLPDRCAEDNFSSVNFVLVLRAPAESVGLSLYMVCRAALHLPCPVVLFQAPLTRHHPCKLMVARSSAGSGRLPAREDVKTIAQGRPHLFLRHD